MRISVHLSIYLCVYSQQPKKGRGHGAYSQPSGGGDDFDYLASLRRCSLCVRVRFVLLSCACARDTLIF